jgi:hypothetical protein
MQTYTGVTHVLASFRKIRWYRKQNNSTEKLSQRKITAQ